MKIDDEYTKSLINREDILRIIYTAIQNKEKTEGLDENLASKHLIEWVNKITSLWNRS